MKTTLDLDFVIASNVSCRGQKNMLLWNDKIQVTKVYWWLHILLLHNATSHVKHNFIIVYGITLQSAKGASYDINIPLVHWNWFGSVHICDKENFSFHFL